MYTGQYFDGKTSKPRVVKVKINQLGLDITYDNSFGFEEKIFWDHQSINRLDIQGDKVIVQYGETLPYESITFDTNKCMDDFERFAFSHPYMRTSHNLFKRWGVKAYLGAGASVLALMLFFYFILIPGVQNTVTNNIPISYEKTLSAHYIAALELTGDIDSLKSKQLMAFIEELNIDTRYDLQAIVLDQDIVNAMALPGGYVVVYTGILKKIESSEELSALIGHEVGHVELKHSLRQLVNSMSKSLLLQAVLGSDALTGMIGELAGSLDQMAYSRDAEREADDFGFHVLEENKLNPQGMVDLFERLKAEHDGMPNSELLNLVSTHPSTDERIENANMWLNEKPYDFTHNEELDSIFAELKERD